MSPRGTFINLDKIKMPTQFLWNERNFKKLLAPNLSGTSGQIPLLNSSLFK